MTMSMRTTIVIEDALEKELKPLISKRGLSAFINECIREYLQRRERQKKRLLLEKAYSRASKNEPISKDFESIETEEWPEW